MNSETSRVQRTITIQNKELPLFKHMLEKKMLAEARIEENTLSYHNDRVVFIVSFAADRKDDFGKGFRHVFPGGSCSADETA